MIKYKKIGIFVGHSKLKDGKYTSATGIKNEYLYNKELGTNLKTWFDKIGQSCDLIICPEGKFISAKEESGYKLPIANSGKYDLIVELHLNSYNGTAKGAEVLYSSNSGKVVAQRVQNKLKTMFTSRGIKQRTDLYILNKTKPVSILLETFFCDNKDDCSIADKKGVKEISRLIAEGIIDTTIKDTCTNTTTDSTYEVNADVLNVRKGRGTEYEKVGTLKKGDRVEIWSISKDSKGENWGSFRYSFTPDVIGYAHMDYLKKI
ncbi:MAG: N-acetylmuramoyl-L-alanine amidase [Peptostreptococcaceae bacterium]|nr:N-acetylmuramoyl-L-alanine amidase [Peptostreptococcaceae bacterium]